MQHQVSDYEAVYNGEGGQHQRRGEGRVPQRPGRAQAKPPVQLQVQKRHEEGEELPTHLLGTLPTFTRCTHQQRSLQSTIDHYRPRQSTIDHSVSSQNATERRRSHVGHYRVIWSTTDTKDHTGSTTIDDFSSLQITMDHYRSPQGTRDHYRSPQITTDYNISLQITVDLSGQQQIMADHNRSLQSTRGHTG